LRYTFYPERFKWSDTREAVFDWLIDDRDDETDVFYYLVGSWYTHIGVACNCHNEFE
jgi:hypothetical protein